MTEKSLQPARPGLRSPSPGGVAHILLLATSECGAGQSALETAVACFTRRRSVSFRSVNFVSVSVPQPKSTAK